MRFYGLITLAAAVIAFLACAVVYKLAIRFRWYPAVRARDVHTTPKPRLGGIAMFIAFVASLGIASQIGWFELVFATPTRILGLVGAATLILIVGVIDDIVDLDWMVKLAAQIVSGLILAFSGIAITSLPIGGITVASQWMSVAVTVLLVVLVMNAVNFIDGLDGLVAGIAIIANGVFLIYSFFLSESLQTSRFSLAALLSAIVVGVCLGFLPWNWNPSKMFMGDGGALLIGLLMAASTISVTGEVDPSLISRDALFPAFLPLLLPIAVLVVPLVDFTLAVVRRLAAGKSPFTADRKHLHHRLLDMGHSQRHAVLLFYGWAAVIGIAALLAFLVQPAWVSPVFLGVGLLICSAFTVAPLSTRKRRETVAQRSTDEPREQHDPLAKRESDNADSAAGANTQTIPPKESE